MVLACPASVASFQALIGRDIICKGMLTLDFAGRFTFSM